MAHAHFATVIVKVIAIADDSPPNASLIRALEVGQQVHCTLRPDWSQPRPASELVPQRRRSSVLERARRAARRRYFAAVDRRDQTELGDRLSSSVPCTSPVHIVSAWEINDNSTEEWLRQEAPDLLVVSGAPLLRPSIYRVPRLGAINVHYGISPTYRGMHTLCVPWWREDYQAVGATIHYINDGIDTGPVLVRVFPELHEDDTPVSVEARLVQQAADEVSALIARFAAGEQLPSGHRFAESGTLIRFNDRRIREHLRFRWRQWRGTGVPPAPARVERYY